MHSVDELTVCLHFLNRHVRRHIIDFIVFIEGFCVGLKNVEGVLHTECIVIID